MNNTVTLPEIAGTAARMAGAEADTATRFVAALFVRIEAALAADGTVAVHGIGTFRRDADAPSGISFTPDKNLAAAINAPFSLFEPVVLPADAPADLFETEPQPGPESEPDETVVIPTIELSAPQEETTIETTADIEEVCREETEQEIKEEDDTTLPQEETLQEAEIQMPAPEPETIYIVRRSPWPWVVALVALVAGFAAGYCLGKRDTSTYSSSASIETAATAVPADTLSIPVDTSTVEPADNTAAQTETLQEEPEEQVPTRQEEQKEAVYDTVSPTRFLTTIARDHYGRKDFWVFIYEANSDILRHPNRIRPGTRVLVPDLGPHAALDADMRQRAHELAAEIYRRYDM